MKKVLAITALLALVVVSAAMASDTTWRFDVNGANQAGTGNKGTAAQLGVGLTSILAFSTATDGGANQVWAGAIGTDGLLHNKESFATNPQTLLSSQTWTAYVAANTNYPSSANGGNMTILVSTSLASFALPTSTTDGLNNLYRYDIYLDGVFQKKLSATEIASTSTTVFSKVVATKFGAGDWKTNGYKVEIKQTVVPEPSSMVAMGAGLMGLVGFAVRRRRA